MMEVDQSAAIETSSSLPKDRMLSLIYALQYKSLETLSSSESPIVFNSISSPMIRL